MALPEEEEEQVVVQHREEAQHELNGAVRHPQGQGAQQGFRLEAELPEPKVGLAPHKVDQKDDQAAQLGQPRGQGAARHPPVEVEDEHIGQAHVDHGGHRHPYGGQDGAVVHLYHHFQAVGEDEADGEDRDNPQIGHRVLQGLGPCPQEEGQLFREEENPHGDGSGENDHDHHGLGEDLLSLPLFPSAQGKGAQGGGPHGQEDGQPRQDVDERQGDVHRRQGGLAHPVGDQDAVNHRVQGEQHHGRSGRNDIAQQLLPAGRGSGCG